MPKRNINKQDHGFTIIEVMIVLAIAGLILLVVFLAVPALQRAARNTQRKDDIAAIAGAINNAIDNNNGALPSGIADDSAATTTELDICDLGGSTSGAASTTQCTTSADFEQAKLGYYLPTNVWIEAAATPTANPTITTSTLTSTTVSIDSVLIVTGESCPSGSGTPVASARGVAIFYAIENGSGAGVLQCSAE